MANANIQIDHTQTPAVDGAAGHVLTDGSFRCTRRDRHGAATTHDCGATMKNQRANINSHINKIHNPNSRYATSQASFSAAHGLGQLTCDRPKRDGTGWCTRTRAGLHSLVSHAREEHGFRGNSSSLTTPWQGLTNEQRAWYQVRVDLELRRQQNGGVYTPEDAALNNQFMLESFPNA
ncbi:hypothetical protein F5Y10DRAFT_268815 [Nemania abortiva]|nr:hypothetical protein F5Y10DRAFT_268815 [Nemania abortiva]